MSAVTVAAQRPRHERLDRWWVQPLLVVLVLGGFSVYALWVLLQSTAHEYFAAPRPVAA